MLAQKAQRFVAIDRRSNGSHRVSLVYNAASNPNPNPIPSSSRSLLPQFLLPSPASPIPRPRSAAPAPTRRSTSSALPGTQPPPTPRRPESSSVHSSLITPFSWLALCTSTARGHCHRRLPLWLPRTRSASARFSPLRAPRRLAPSPPRAAAPRRRSSSSAAPQLGRRPPPKRSRYGSQSATPSRRFFSCPWMTVWGRGICARLSSVVGFGVVGLPDWRRVGYLLLNEQGASVQLCCYGGNHYFRS
jgi:hypothetical protein